MKFVKNDLEINNLKQIQEMNRMVLLVEYIVLFLALTSSIFGFETPAYFYISCMPIFTLWQLNQDLNRVRYVTISVAELTEIYYFYHLLQATEVDTVLFLAGFGIFYLLKYMKERIAKDPIQIVIAWLTHYFLWISVIYYSHIGPKMTVRDIFLIFAVGFAWAYVKYDSKWRKVSLIHNYLELERHQIRQRFALNCANTGVLILDINSKVLLANKVIRQILNVRDDDQLEKKLDEIFIEGISLMESLKKYEKVIFRQFQFEYYEINPSGETFIYANDITHILEGQNKNQVIADLKAAARDNEEEIQNVLEHDNRHRAKQQQRIRIQDDTIEANQYQIRDQKIEIKYRQNECEVQLNEIKSLRRQLDETKSIIRLTSHEFKAPNCVIINSLTPALERNDIDKSTRDATEVSLVTSKLLLYLAHSMMDYTSLDSEHFSVNKQDFNLREVVNEVSAMVEVLAKWNNLQLITTFGKYVPKIAHTDPNRLKQILLNICSNAVKFTKIGHIQINIQDTFPDHINITVADTGIGIASQDVVNLFNYGSMFGDRADNPTGSGLGLYITKELVRLLDGTPITVISDKGKGTFFNFYLPITQEFRKLEIPDFTSSDPQDSNEIESSSGIPFQNAIISRNIFQYDSDAKLPKVLIVDDSVFNRFGLTQILKKFNVSVDEATDGQEAINKITARDAIGWMYSLTIMDIEMHGMSGLETTQKLRQMLASGVISRLSPIVGHTAHTAQEDIEMCIAAGMDKYLSKSCSDAELKNILDEYVFN